MKAISLIQPYATFIAEGIKTIETRTWRTNYRGRILICASMTKPLSLATEYEKLKHGLSFPRGVALATAELITCRDMAVGDEDPACFPRYEGAVAWVLGDIRKVKPFKVKGQLGIFNVDIDDMYEKEPAQLSLFN